MAIRAAVLVPSDQNIEHQVIRWLLLLNSDTGEVQKYAEYSDRSVQVVGTFGVGGSVSIQGSNDGGTNWATLTDPQGVAMTFTAAGLRQILELTDRIRCIVTAGDGSTSLNVHLFMRKESR